MTMKNIVQYGFFLLCIVILCLSYAKPISKPKKAITKNNNKVHTTKNVLPDSLYCKQINNQPIPHTSYFNNLYLICDKDSIFRSKQPNEDDFRWLLDTFKIKSILKLNPEKDTDDFGYLTNPQIKDRCIIQMDYDDSLDTFKLNKDVIKAIWFLKTAPKPLLIHCSAGVDRTGLVVALYKRLYGMRKDSAQTEMLSIINDYYHKGLKPRWNKLFNYFNKFDDINIDTLRKDVEKEIFKPQIIDSNLETSDYPQEYSGITSFNDSLYLLEEKKS